MDQISCSDAKLYRCSQKKKPIHADKLNHVVFTLLADVLIHRPIGFAGTVILTFEVASE
jgi:hypothetical protein